MATHAYESLIQYVNWSYSYHLVVSPRYCSGTVCMPTEHLLEPGTQNPMEKSTEEGKFNTHDHFLLMLVSGRVR